MFSNPQVYRTKCVESSVRLIPFLNTFSSQVTWNRPNGNESLLDIGCGPGNVTMQFILPLLPDTYSRLVATDISKDMIEYAKNNFNHQPKKISFQVLDIGDANAVNQFLTLNGTFDYITSFYCLHWLLDQYQTFQNIYNLLAPGGECFIVLVAKSPIFEFFEIQSKKDSFCDIIKDYKKYMSPYQYSDDIQYEVSNTLQSVGYSRFKVEVQDSNDYLKGVNGLKGKIWYVIYVIYLFLFFRYYNGYNPVL